MKIVCSVRGYRHLGAADNERRKSVGQTWSSADVEAADIGVAKGAAQTAEIVLTSDELAGEIGEVPAKVIIINNFFALDEITDKLAEAVK